MLTLTLVGVDEDATRAAATRIDAPAKWLAPLAADLAVEGDVAALRAEADAALTGLPVDFCIQPSEGRRKALFVADMDSTIIGCECLDELADFAGLKAQIAAITERAMRGDIEFEGARRGRRADPRPAGQAGGAERRGRGAGDRSGPDPGRGRRRQRPGHDPRRRAGRRLPGQAARRRASRRPRRPRRPHRASLLPGLSGRRVRPLARQTISRTRPAPTGNI